MEPISYNTQSGRIHIDESTFERALATEWNKVVSDSGDHFRDTIACGTILADKITAGSISPIRIAMRQKNYKRDYDEDILTIEVPGVPKDEIEVFTQKDFLYVKIRDESPIVNQITDEQTIRSVKLDLGILTVVIDNAEKRKLIEIE